MATNVNDMTDEEVSAELEVLRDPNRQLVKLYRRRDAILQAGAEWANGDKKRRDADLAEVQKQIALIESSLEECITFCDVEVTI